MANKQSAKDILCPHSEAKVVFYQKYLERYLNILVETSFFRTINIYDVFCGRGIYDDGGHGSPIRAFDVIKDLNENISHNKVINLFLNDKSESCTNKVKSYIDPKNENNCVCNVYYKNEDAELLLERLAVKLQHTNKDTRNLIFIDPYGYKYIHKETLEKLMRNGYTEILLFLPISFMHRFSNYAVDTDSEAHKPLKDFIESFFPEGHPVRSQEPLDVLEYIKHLSKAFSFDGKYYTTSYHIERDANSYFALFFFSSNKLGFEKILEVKWQLDEVDGNGFKKPVMQKSLFDELEADEKKQEHYEILRIMLIGYLRNPRSNDELYEFILRNEYLPRHANPILKELQNEKLITVKDYFNGTDVRKGSFYLSSDGIKKHKVLLQVIACS